jgi:signal transduction histidine kinase
MNNLFFSKIHARLILSFLFVVLILLPLLIHFDEQSDEKAFTKHLISLFLYLVIITPLVTFVVWQSFNQMANQLKQRTETLAQQLQMYEVALLIAKQEAEYANQAKKQFIDNIGHDLRSPLNAVLGFSDILLHTKNLPDEHYEHIRIIHNSGKHLLSIIDTIVAKNKQSEILLIQQNFQVMPTTWLSKLYKTVLEADSEQVMSLIQDIPPTETLLIKPLTELVQRFQFEAILDLIEPLIMNDDKLNDTAK